MSASTGNAYGRTQNLYTRELFTFEMVRNATAGIPFSSCLVEELPDIFQVLF